MSKKEYRYWDCEQPKWHRIDNIKSFDLDEVKIFHPSDPRYISYWKEEKKRCIEGLWRKQFGKWMHMPGCLYFYGKFGIIVDTDKFTKVTKKIKPLIHDLEWEQAFYYWLARGFSGWLDDDEFTSDNLWFLLKEEGVPTVEELENMDPSRKAALLNVINSKGQLKEYKSPFDNLRELKDKPLGRPLFQNEARNTMIVGSRSGGKSYFESVGKHCYTLTFDGATEYPSTDIQKVETCIGSGDTDKSGEMVQKVIDSMNEFALNSKLGVWGKQGDADWTPNPFFRDMNGPTGPGNKQKGGWQHKYKKKVQGRWVDGFGTGTRMFHVSYSANKKAGAEAGAGGRYNITSIEEVGLTQLAIEAWNSNRATVRRNGIQFGIQSFLGTSGNVELILPTKEMFTNPKEFGIVSFKNVWECPEDEIGFFLPAYMTYRQFKDKNGNTDVKKARTKWLEGYREAVNSSNPKTLRMYCMNYPDVPSHMWVSDKNYLLPYEEAVQREKELMQNQLFKSIGKAVSLRWDHTQPTKVTADIVHNPDPFYDFPIRSDKERIDGEIMIYKEPELVHGEVPNDMYLFTHDPYVSDDQEEGASLGVTYVFLSPKYASTHEADIIVASYIGKPEGGKKVYYENLEKLLAYYGNPIRGLNYEANRGEFCRSYFAKKGKVFLLMPRPQFTKGDSMQAKKVSQFGTIVGAHGSISKITMIDDTYDYLLEEATYNREIRRVIETIPCIFLLRQIQQFELKGNFDAVSALILYPTSRGELRHYLLAQNKQKQTNKLSFLSTNKLVS